MNRPLPAPARDIALLLARVLLGVVMFAHGYQKMIINGIGRTTDGFENLSIPLAIVSASFVTVVEFAGSVMLIFGALTPLVSALMLVIMGGAAIFVHIPNGIFVADGGWELVGVIAAGMIVLAATGPGRYSVDHLVALRQELYRRELAVARSGMRPAHARRGSAVVPAARTPEVPVAFRETAPTFQEPAPGAAQPTALPSRADQATPAFQETGPFEAARPFRNTRPLQHREPEFPWHNPTQRDVGPSFQDAVPFQDAGPFQDEHALMSQDAAPMFQEGPKVAEPTLYQQPAPMFEEPAQQFRAAR